MKLLELLLILMVRICLKSVMAREGARSVSSSSSSVSSAFDWRRERVKLLPVPKLVPARWAREAEITLDVLLVS